MENRIFFEEIFFLFRRRLEKKDVFFEVIRRNFSQMIEQMNPGCELSVDGGIDEASAPMAVAAGANVLVAGSSVFGANKTVAAAMEALREAVMQAAH